MGTPEDLERRIAVIWASHAEMLAAINSVGATQQVLADALREYSTRMSSVESTALDTNQRIRAIEESLAEIKGLLVRALGG
jgi:hypothetical protein